MTLLKRKFQTGQSVLREQGWSGLFRIMIGKRNAWLGKIRKWWQRNDHWLVGKLVELQGNWVKVDGCTFYVKSPFISTSLKSRFLLNRYEKPERDALAYLNPAVPIIELGAGIGVISCLANKRLIQPDRHIVVEANPFLLPLLYKNRERNSCQFMIINAAIGYGQKTTRLYLQREFIDSNIFSGDGREIVLTTTTVAQIADTFGFDHCALICDIEGAEVDLVSRESSFLDHCVDFVIFEIHETTGKIRNDQMIAELQHLGFSIQWLSRKIFLGQKNGQHFSV